MYISAVVRMNLHGHKFVVKWMKNGPNHKGHWTLSYNRIERQSEFLVSLKALTMARYGDLKVY